jgi:hypothetical protein
VLVRAAPLVITVSVIAAILAEVPPAEIARQVALGTAWPLWPLALFSTLVTLVMVATADVLVIRACNDGAPVRWIEVLGAKAGSSLVDIFSYAAGHGAYAVWVARFYRRRAALAGGVMLFIVAGDLLSVSAVAAVAMLFTGDEIPSGVVNVAVGAAVVLSLCLLSGPYKLLGERVRFFEPWWVVPRWIGFGQAAIRSVHVVFWALATWVATQAFGLEIPLHAMMLYLPIVMMVGALPVNVAGFGAVQGAWLLLFGDHVPGPQLLAFVVVWTVAVQTGVVLRGLPFVRRVVSEIDGRSKGG